MRKRVQVKPMAEIRITIDREEVEQTKAILKQGMDPRQIRKDIANLVSLMPKGRMRDEVFLTAELTLQQAEKELGRVSIQ